MGILSEMVSSTYDGPDIDAAMWGLGVLGGLQPVLGAMTKEGPKKLGVVRGGILALCECAWQAVGNNEELALLPPACSLLLECLTHEKPGSVQLKDCTKALSCCVTTLAPHAPPGRLVTVDQCVEALINQVKTVDGIEQDTWYGDADRVGTLAAEVAAEGIGRVALASSEWREAFQRCGTLDTITHSVRSECGSRRLQKYLFWAAAAIGGLPFVVSEVRLNMTSVDVVDAALCTVIAILDDDIAGEYALVGVERCAEPDASGFMNLVIECMKCHPSVPEVQSHGCHCLGLLIPVAPLDSLASVAVSTIEVVFAAWRRFSRRFDTVQAVFTALREFVMLQRPPGADKGVRNTVMEALREEDIADCLDQVLGEPTTGRHYEELLEDAVVVLVHVSGPEIAVQRLLDSPSGCVLRTAGLKALFEMARAELQLFSSHALKLMAEAATTMAAEEDDGTATRLKEVAALLTGICGGGAAPRHD